LPSSPKEATPPAFPTSEIGTYVFGRLSPRLATASSVYSFAAVTAPSAAVLTNAVVAICVVFVPAVAVGAVGVPVKSGLASGALRAKAFVIVVAKFASLPMAAAISLSVFKRAGEESIKFDIAVVT
jgi:hypothetical protein